MHAPGMMLYILAATVAFGLDRLLRLVKTRFAHAYITPLSELGMTKIEIPTLNAGWRAGQHVRVRVLSRRMGIIRWIEAHPYTIACAGSVSRTLEVGLGEKEGKGELMLLIKQNGRWSQKLYEIASESVLGVDLRVHTVRLICLHTNIFG